MRRGFKRASVDATEAGGEVAATEAGEGPPFGGLPMTQKVPSPAVPIGVLHSQRSRRVRACALSMALTIAILYIRKPDAFRNPSRHRFLRPACRT